MKTILRRRNPLMVCPPAGGVPSLFPAAILVAAALAPLACSPSARPAPGGAVESMLIYGRSADADSIDPVDTINGESVKILVNVFDTLVTYAEDGPDLVPGLATAWTEAKDRLHWTLTLRPSVTFHDGSPVDADAVVFTFQRLIDPKNEFLFDAKH
ncbi:MAG: ABC transporter substrate-binding protein, partial [Planctomycetia bacterium]